MSKAYLTTILILSLVCNAVLIYRISNAPQVPDPVPEDTAPVMTEVNPESGGSFPFIRVVDGDTVIVGVDSRSEYVRLIGIDSPEPNDPGGPECYATEATEHIKELARTGTVVLHFDDTQGARDTYNRLLAYVELPDGTDLGERMLRDGYAREFTYDQPYERRDTYLVAENDALTNEAGLWAEDTCQ